MIESYTGVYRRNSIIIPAQRESNSLYQNGYGSMLQEEGVLTLTLCEALFLVEGRKLSVISEESREQLSFSELLMRFTSVDKLMWTRYLVFRDLRSKGYVVKPGYELGVDFLVYERGEYGKKPPKYLIFAVWEGEPKTMDEIMDVLKKAHEKDKILKLAVIDRRGELVHYTLQELHLKEGKAVNEGPGESIPS